MDSFLKAAIKVLEGERRALTSHEIIHAAISKGLLKTEGLTPEKTLNARLSEHLLEHKQDSIIMRTDSGEFGLRSWSDRIPEWVAPRRKLSPIEEDILVFSAERIGEFVSRDGLNAANKLTLKKLVESSRSMRRMEAEEDYSVVQLVSSFLITHKGKILTYHRSKRLPEKRLHDAYCMIFGGHITFEDKMPLFGLDEKKFIELFMRRELDEEVLFVPPPEKLVFKGFIYDSTTQMGRQHIGIVFHVPTKTNQYSIGERGFLLGDSFESKKAVKDKISEFDSWSRMIAQGYLDGKW